ncbi:MAG TPA: 4a-hydroxytetrahydrobiopterin dehydratase [Actinocrinis sp.]|nr:4a-hydroxytetrahydrobiopterin dehydratase [Actinocrinis sp.]
MPRRLDDQEIARERTTLDGWFGGPYSMSRLVQTDSFAAAMDLATRTAAAAGELDHYPDIDIRGRSVRFAVTTHTAGGLTDLDVTLARRIDAIVRTALPG